MPPKPSETDLELVTSDEEMELETEPYSSDDELEEEEEKETRDSGDDESVVDAEEFKKGKKSRRVLADTSKSEWIRYLMKELVALPDDYFQSKEKKKRREEISVALRKRDIIKTEHQIEFAIRDYFHVGRKLRFPLNDEDVKNEKVIRERAAARLIIGVWRHVLLKELCEHPGYLDRYNMVADRRLYSVLKNTYHIEKSEKQIRKEISRLRGYAARGDCPSWMTKKEKEDFMKSLASKRLTVKKTKSNAPKIRSRVPGNVIGGRVEKKTNKRSKRRDTSPMMTEDEDEEVENEAINDTNEEMLSETESCAPKRGKRASTKNVIGDRIDKKKNKRDESGDVSPMFSDDEDEDLGKAENKAVELRNEMLQELERAKEKEREMAEKLRETEEANEKLRRIVKKQETSVAAEKEATVEGEAQFSVLSEVEKMRLPEEQQHFVTLKGMTIGTGKFLLTDLIGAGTFGVVFRAVEKKTGNVCALKIVQTHAVIVTELKFMRRINNGGLMNKFLAPPLHSFADTHNGVDFTAFQMELLHVDLFTVVVHPDYEKKRFPPVAVLSILGQVFSALAYMNERGLVYSDVKPDNIMLKTFDLESSGGEFLIVNPEIRIVDLNAVHDIDDRPERCQSAHYRAPEVIFGYEFSKKVDSWSMGILGLELLKKEFVMPVEYDEDVGVHEHIVRIEYLTDDQIPEKMWRPSRINMRELPNVPDDQMSMAEILDDLKPSLASFGLQHYIPRLLKIDPNDRPTPAEAAEWLKDAFPHP